MLDQNHSNPLEVKRAPYFQDQLSESPYSHKAREMIDDMLKNLQREMYIKKNRLEVKKVKPSGLILNLLKKK